jgi:predicted  nucleic acid-binding Zn-ribbon protein
MLQPSLLEHGSPDDDECLGHGRKAAGASTKDEGTEQMLTAPATMTSKKDIATVSSSRNEAIQDLESLSERLLRQQPETKALLERLLARSRRKTKQSAFTPLQGNRCSACNMTVASAQIQKLKAGEFINCAHCSIFLYHEQR